MLREHVFDTGEVTLNYAEGPDNGPPLIMFSGFTGRWQAFSALIPVLSPDWHIYALDHRGHGKSGRTPGRYLPSDFTSDYLAFLEGLVAEPAVLLGSSAGGAMALELAAKTPGQVRAVIGLDPPVDTAAHVDNFGPDMLSEYVDMQRMAGRPVEELLREVPQERAEELSFLDPEVLRYHAEGRLHEYFADLLPMMKLESIACPVMLVLGNPDLGALATERAETYAQSTLSRLTVVHLDDRGHEVGLEADAPWVPAMLAFLGSV